MYYIITTKAFSEMQKYNIPLVENTNCADLHKFFKTNEGKVFSKIDPLFIKKTSSMDELKKQLQKDMTQIKRGTCFYVYIMRNSFYEKSLSLHLEQYSHSAKGNQCGWSNRETFEFGNIIMRHLQKGISFYEFCVGGDGKVVAK